MMDVGGAQVRKKFQEWGRAWKNMSRMTKKAILKAQGLIVGTDSRVSRVELT